jgi:hypothetical protein
MTFKSKKDVFSAKWLWFISLKDNQDYRLHNTSTLSDIDLYLGTGPPCFLLALFLLETVRARSNLFEQQ